MAGVLIASALAWAQPLIPVLPRRSYEVRVPDSTGKLHPLVAKGTSTFSMYVCGITPYDATHLGHAATYIVFDVLNRVARDSGLNVHFVENVTDVDDPLFERARLTNREWQEIASEQTTLFKSDMTALNVIPPDNFVWASDAIGPVIDLVEGLIEKGRTYRIDNKLYLDVAGASTIEAAQKLNDQKLIDLVRQRGGDPDTSGKHGPLDPVVWVVSDSEPCWVAPFGTGRPGWHVECVAIANQEIGLPFDLQGGGADLIFPHHQMCSATAELWRSDTLARRYMHTGLIWLGDEKMSKSLGNLVFVSQLLADGVDPMQIRLALLDRDWRADLHWSDKSLKDAEARLTLWQVAARGQKSGDDGEQLARLRSLLANGLDTEEALQTMDEWSRACTDRHLFASASDALLGVRLTP